VHDRFDAIEPTSDEAGVVATLSPTAGRGNRYARSFAAAGKRVKRVPRPGEGVIDVGDAAPEFTAPLANGSIESFSLSEHLDEAPIVLAFFPAAFTGTCTTEMTTFQEQLADFEAVGASIYGISIDSPFTLNEFRARNDIEFPLISDVNRELIDLYGVSMDFADLGVYDVAKRSVFVVDGDGTVTYAWQSDDPSVEPDYAAVEEAAAAAAN
jgi:peroxiredoxin